MEHKLIRNAIIKSQHCQRNWDLTQEISEEDMNLLVTAATECPSKQNVAFYKVHFITDRDLIEDIHDTTRGFTTNKHPSGYETNTQTLANLLVLFEQTNIKKTILDDTVSRNEHTRAYLEGNWNDVHEQQLKRDTYTAVGVAAGYLNVIATLLGYSTGCCQCFDHATLQQVACIKGAPLLLMGIGYSQKGVNRRRHHIRTDFMFSTKKKQPIQVEFHK